MVSASDADDRCEIFLHSERRPHLGPGRANFAYKTE